MFKIGDRVIYNFDYFIFTDLEFPPLKCVILNKSSSKCEFFGNEDYYKIKIIGDYCIEVVNAKYLTIDEDFYKREKREEIINEIIKWN